MGDYLETCTGKRFYYAKPTEDSICIEAIAHALSLQCRFNGHVKHLYSVAQHCCHVSNALPREFRLQGLLHDAAEAYIGDIVSPFKDQFPEIQKMEDEILKKIFSVFDCSFPLSKEVLDSDRRMLYTEFRDLGFAEFGLMRDSAPEPYEIVISPWSSTVAESQFLKLFREIQLGKYDNYSKPLSQYDQIW